MSKICNLLPYKFLPFRICGCWTMWTISSWGYVYVRIGCLINSSHRICRFYSQLCNSLRVFLVWVDIFFFTSKKHTGNFQFVQEKYGLSGVFYYTARVFFLNNMLLTMKREGFKEKFKFVCCVSYNLHFLIRIGPINLCSLIYDYMSIPFLRLTKTIIIVCLIFYFSDYWVIIC